MGRPRKDFGAAGDSMLEALARRGLPATEIVSRLRKAGIPGVSLATVSRRVQVARKTGGSKAKASPASATAKAAPEAPPVEELPVLITPDEIPEDASIAMIDKWIRDAEDFAREAREEGNLAGFCAAGRLVSTLFDRRRKAMPIPREDPNARPDFVALAEQVRARLHAYVDEALGGAT